MEGKYYTCGDTAILVLKILNSDSGDIYLCLCFSFNHRNYSVMSINQDDFMEFYYINPDEDSSFDCESTYPGLQ